MWEKRGPFSWSRLPHRPRSGFLSTPWMPGVEEVLTQSRDVPTGPNYCPRRSWVGRHVIAPGSQLGRWQRTCVQRLLGPEQHRARPRPQCLPTARAAHSPTWTSTHVWGLNTTLASGPAPLQHWAPDSLETSDGAHGAWEPPWLRRKGGHDSWGFPGTREAGRILGIREGRVVQQRLSRLPDSAHEGDELSPPHNSLF